MKSLKAICPAVLALALSIPAYAGDIQTPGSPQPPPPLRASITLDNGSDNPEVPTSDNISNAVLADILWALTSIF